MRQLYYQNYLTSFLLKSASYYDDNQQSTACSGSDEYEDRSFPTASDAQIYTIAIPPQVFGEQISRNSLKLSPNDKSSYNIIDDGNGNLIDTINSNIHVGNVIYSQGLLIITNQSYTGSLGVPQVWTTRNLDVTTYRNGDAIPQANISNWSTLTTGAWIYYTEDSNLGPTYGKLYNWYAVNDPRGLAPEGYHIPTKTEWDNLVNALGGYTQAGGKLKEIGTSHWDPPNTGATDVINFSALPGGYITPGASFNFLGAQSYFWTSTLQSVGSPWAVYITTTSDDAFPATYTYRFGLSVRLIKD
jgi:uncharacterized protein (TIGR02145 family)